MGPRPKASLLYAGVTCDSLVILRGGCATLQKPIPRGVMGAGVLCEADQLFGKHRLHLRRAAMEVELSSKRQTWAGLEILTRHLIIMIWH